MEHAGEEHDVDELMGQFHEYLSKKQLKSTRQRDIIARQFFSTEGHLSIEELLALAREENPRIGYATVYRTLKLLTECGLAAQRRFGEGQAIYETAGDTEHHDHLICIECDHVLEFTNDEIERLQDQVARSFGFNLVRQSSSSTGCAPRRAASRAARAPAKKKKDWNRIGIVLFGDAPKHTPKNRFAIFGSTPSTAVTAVRRRA